MVRGQRMGRGCRAGHPIPIYCVDGRWDESLNIIYATVASMDAIGDIQSQSWSTSIACAMHPRPGMTIGAMPRI
ncbi:MAG: hypothetical protein QW136_00080 [Nitrososphaerales archaeon]